MGVQIINASVLDGLAQLPDESVNCVVTSPPYYGLRDYGTGRWEGGSADCDHKGAPQQSQSSTLAGNGHGNGKALSPQLQAMTQPFKEICGKCGAKRVDDQIGLEPTPAIHIERMVEVFREVRRVLRKDGTVWLNYGDAYANDGKSGGESSGKQAYLNDATREEAGNRQKRRTGFKPKDRMMLPARLAIALQDDGWWIRDEIVWHKPNPMPSSVADRTTPSHEMIYLLTRSARYHYDGEAIKEPMSDVSVQRLTQPSITSQRGGDKQDAYDVHGLNDRTGSRRPNEIVQGLAARRGKNELSPDRTKSGFNARWDAKEAHQRLNNQSEKLVAGEKWGARHEGWQAVKDSLGGRNKRSVWTVATEPFPEAHFATFPTALIEPCIKAGCSVGGTVLDPFGGSGTTGLVADRLQRNAILIELNPEYAAMARRRIDGDRGGLLDLMEAVA